MVPLFPSVDIPTRSRHVTLKHDVFMKDYRFIESTENLAPSSHCDLRPKPQEGSNGWLLDLKGTVVY